MDSIVEENGNSNNLEDIDNASGGGGGGSAGPSRNVHHLPQRTSSSNTTSLLPPHSSSSSSSSVLTTTGNVVQYLPTSATAAAHSNQVQSVIQAANQSSVIQTAAANTSPVTMPKCAIGVLFVSKPNSTVIHTTPGNAAQLPSNYPCKIKPEPHSQTLDTNSEDSLSDEDSPRRRRELTRRPSYHKIFNDISGPDISAGTTLQQMQENAAGLSPLLATTTTPGSTGGTLMHLPPDSASAFYIPNNSGIPEDQTRKREIRLQKNREAARECRRKKKEYIKCLENRVAVLENQNKALIEELKSLKELYCQTKID